MRAILVSESYDTYYENRLYESILNEKFDLNKAKEFISKIGNKKKAIANYTTRFNKEKNFNVKKSIVILLMLLVAGNFMAKNNKWANSKEFYNNLEKESIELASKPNITSEKIIKISKDIIEVEIASSKLIFSVGDSGLIDEINKHVPGRLENKKIERYDKYDSDILKAVNNLKAYGEKPDANFIKAIMIIETGMFPRKNNLGYEGFPQTKQYIIDSINKKYKTNFTLQDMYNAEKSAEFIHYFTKGLQKSQYVNTMEDIIIAYNWGIGNLGKYKRGEKELPKESKNYVTMMKVMQKYFS